MKIILLLGSLLASSSYFYFMGHADGYRAGQLEVVAPLSDCYTTGAIHDSRQKPCLVVE